jgi:hypothetical protein
MSKSKYNHTAYRGSSPSTEMPDRQSTMLELAEWMNSMARSVSSGIYHWVTKGEIHWAKRSMDDSGKWTEVILDWGVLCQS